MGDASESATRTSNRAAKGLKPSPSRRQPLDPAERSRLLADVAAEDADSGDVVAEDPQAPAEALPPHEPPRPPPPPYTPSDCERDVRDLVRVPHLVFGLLRQRRSPALIVDTRRASDAAERIARAAAPRLLSLGRFNEALFWGGILAATLNEFVGDAIDSNNARAVQPRTVDGAIIRQAAAQ